MVKLHDPGRAAVYFTMAKTPVFDLILATAPTKYITSSFDPQRFETAMVQLAAALEAGKIFNQEFIFYKSSVANGTEHAQHIAAREAQERKSDGSAKFFPRGDARNNIGYAFQMNQAAPMARRLRKLKEADMTGGIRKYIATLDQIAAINLWLKQFKAIIVKGRKPAENPTPIDLSNTGACSVCENRQKLASNDNMVHHGYKISDGLGHYFGQRLGKCFGCDFKPYEFSCEGNVAYKAFLESELARARAYVAELKARSMESFSMPRNKTVAGVIITETVTLLKGTPEYESERESRIRRTTWNINQLKEDIRHQSERINTWKLQELAYGR